MIEFLIKEIEKLSLPQIIGYSQILIALACWYALLLWKRREVFTDFRGTDRMWQFVEWVAIFWLTFAPASFVAHLFAVPFGEDIWSFMELVFFIAVAGKSAQKFIEMRYGIPQEKEVVKTEVSIKKTETKNETTPLDEVEQNQ